jgi:hypothetical protein
VRDYATASREIIHEDRAYTITVFLFGVEMQIEAMIESHWHAMVREQGRLIWGKVREQHGQKIVYKDFHAKNQDDALDQVEAWFRDDWKRDPVDGLLWNRHTHIRRAEPPIILFDEYTGETR